MAETADYLIVGGGPAGTRAAEAIRKRDSAGRIVIVSDEPYPFYNRILLSKDFLAADALTPETTFMKSSAVETGQGIERLAGVRVIGLDPGQRRAELAGGTLLEYGRCLIASGAEALRLPVPGADRPGVFPLRSLDDAIALRDAARAADRAVVVGGGLVGLEVAAALAGRGIACTLVAREEWLLGHIAPASIGGALERLFCAHGVALALRTVVRAIEPAPGGLAVVTGEGTRLTAPLVPTGAGVRPRVEFLARTGLAEGGAVPVDARLRSRDRNVWAAGDVAAWDDPRLGFRHRVEHWLHAQHQGRLAGENMTGGSAEYVRATAYDTTLFGTRVSAHGDAGAATEWVTRGAVVDGAGIALGLRTGRVVAAIGIGETESAATVTALVERAVTAKGAELADLARPLETWI